MIALMWIRLYVLPDAFQMPMILLKDASASGQIKCLREHAYSSSDALSNIGPVRADICRQHAEARSVTLLCIGRRVGLDRPDSRQKQFFFPIAIQAAHHPYRSAQESVPMHSICVWQSYNYTSRTARNTWCVPSKLEILRTHTISDRREEFRTPRA